MKDNKLVEKYDDNPGAYFGMLVEGLEDKEESLKEDYVTDLVAEILGKKFPMNKRNIKWLSNNGTSGEVEYKGQKFAFRKLPNGDYKVMRSSDAGWNWSETLFKDESLKESVSKSDLYSALEYMYGFNKKEANDWIKKASDKMKQSVVDGWKGNAKKSALTDSLKEDKFVSRDKMSKKDRKELDSQKRNTWGNTNPVTRVQPNKKAYDRKRDSKVVMEESKKLNESSDGWDESKLSDLSEILDEIYNLQYEVQNTVRGAYTNAHTYEELGYYVHNLGSNLMDIGDEIMEMEEEDEEDED